MCGAQFGSGECSWLFSAVFYSWLCFTRQTVARNNADSLINKFTIQAGYTKGCKVCVYVCEREKEHTVFTTMPLTTTTFSLVLQVKSKQERDLKVKTFAPPYVCRIQIPYLNLTFFFSPNIVECLFGLVSYITDKNKFKKSKKHYMTLRFCLI